MKKKINKKKYVFFLFIILMLILLFFLLLFLLFNFQLFKFNIPKSFKQKPNYSEQFSVEQFQEIKYPNKTDFLIEQKEKNNFLLKNNELNDKNLIEKEELNDSEINKKENKNSLLNNPVAVSSSEIENGNYETNQNEYFFSKIKYLNEIIDNLKQENYDLVNINEQLQEENVEFTQENLQLLKKYQKLDLSFKQFSHYVFLELNSGINYGMTKEQVKILINRIKKDSEINQLKYGIKTNDKKYYDEFMKNIPENSKNKYSQLLTDDKNIIDCLVSLGLFISAYKWLSLVII
ncbi:hypothetical protein FEF22_001335 [Texas Phoenix palm phytoplasma]|uniref:Effector n=1 Tax=Texas Phoenix palm phytoplasma TaxID=176709 RepID=A0ABS5BKY7_9MOLU|nr:hypothetical protein [Texas Phoenix palm phytoplasma]MBP3059427.1 hypothetical protein [Texas Phoenix palm phytoplasma]